MPIFCSHSSSSLKGFCSTYATYLGGAWYGLLSCFSCKEKCAFKAPNTIKHITKFVVYYLHHLAAFSFVCICVARRSKIVNYINWCVLLPLNIGSLFVDCTSCHVCTAICVGLHFLLVVCFALLPLYLYRVKFIFMISREAASCIPISTSPLLRTTKNTQHFLMFLNFMNTVHVPNCMILVLLYV